MENVPFPEVVAARVTPIAAAVAVTAAPGTTAPAESWTVPKTVPEFNCATALRLQAATSAIKIPRLFTACWALRRKIRAFCRIAVSLFVNRLSPMLLNCRCCSTESAQASWKVGVCDNDRHDNLLRFCRGFSDGT